MTPKKTWIGSRRFAVSPRGVCRRTHFAPQGSTPTVSARLPQAQNQLQ